MPLLVTHSPWVYWFLAGIGFIVHNGFSYRVVNRVFYQKWVRNTSGYKAQGYFHGPLVDSAPAMVFLGLSLLVYSVATYLGQYGYAFAW
jgi:hypothetical protein